MENETLTMDSTESKPKNDYLDLIVSLHTDLCDRIPYAEESEDIIENVKQYIYKLEKEKAFLMSDKPLGINKFAHELLKEKDILEEKIREVYEIIGNYVSDELFSHSYAMEELETALKEYNEIPKSISKHHTSELVNELRTREGVKDCVVNAKNTYRVIYNITEGCSSSTSDEGPAKILIVKD